MLTTMTAFVNFPSSYTQSTVERAFRKYLPEVSITTDKPSDKVQIQYADCEKNSSIMNV